MNKDFKKNIIRDVWVNPNVVSLYAATDYDKGLWKSEEVLIRRFFPKSSYILDIGCGAGRTTIPLARLGYRVVGIDLSPGMVEAARQKALQNHLNIDFHEMDAGNLSFAERSFDGALFSFNGFDYIPGYSGKLSVLCEIFRVLKPGSNLIFSTHQLWNTFHLKKLLLSGLKMNIARIMGSNILEKEWGEIYDVNANDDERYLHFMSTRKWKRALRAAGFSPVLSQPRYHLEYDHLKARIKRGLSCTNYMFYIATKPQTTI